MIDEIGIDGFKAATPENIWYNGAYTCTEYIQQNTKTLTKNPLYWDTEAKLFDSVTVKMVESVDTAYQLYTTGELDHVDLSESCLLYTSLHAKFLSCQRSLKAAKKNACIKISQQTRSQK